MTTPPHTSNPLQVHETPSVARRTSQWQYLTGQLDLARLAVMQDLRSVPLITLEFLFDNVLPPIPSSVDLKTLKRKLRSENLVRENGWRGFETPPKDSKDIESMAFSPFVQVFDDVLKSVLQDKTLSAVLQMKHCPDSAPLSQRANSSRPDGFLELLDRNSVDTDVEKSNWEDIPVSMEFKKSNSDKDQHDVRLMLAYLDPLTHIRCPVLESSQDHLELTPYDAQRFFSPLCLWNNNRKYRNEGMVLLSVSRVSL